MNHPQREEWVPYIFGEATGEARRRLEAHFENCGECRQELEEWQRSLGRLDAWKLPRPHRAQAPLQPALGWAMAAALVVILAAGFLLGRLSGTSPASVRAAIEPGLRAQLQKDFGQLLRDELAKNQAATLSASTEQSKGMLEEMAKVIEARQGQDNQTMYAAIERVYALLKKDLDTVALNTDAGLRHTEQQLVQLTDLGQQGKPATPGQHGSLSN